MVYWEDIQSDSGWRTLKEIQKSKPAICVSTGWLVKENRDVHILMSDYNYDETMSCQMVVTLLLYQLKMLSKIFDKGTIIWLVKKLTAG